MGSPELQYLTAGIGGEILTRLGPVKDCCAICATAGVAPIVEHTLLRPEATRDEILGASASVKIEASTS